MGGLVYHCHCRYVALSPLRLVRRSTIPFYQRWAEGKRRELLAQLKIAAQARALDQLTRLGELDKTVAGRDVKDTALLVRGATTSGGKPLGLVMGVMQWLCRWAW
jgi:hypothetical protein